MGNTNHEGWQPTPPKGVETTYGAGPARLHLDGGQTNRPWALPPPAYRTEEQNEVKFPRQAEPFEKPQTEPTMAGNAELAKPATLTPRSPLVPLRQPSGEQELSLRPPLPQRRYGRWVGEKLVLPSAPDSVEDLEPKWYRG